MWRFDHPVRYDRVIFYAFSPLYFLRVAMPPRICRSALLISSSSRT
nr:MAG TPA: hypothetical protein [Caudoviricetes sp.]